VTYTTTANKTSVPPVIYSVTIAFGNGLPPSVTLGGTGFGSTAPQTLPVGDGSYDTQPSNTTPFIAIYDNITGFQADSKCTGHCWRAGFAGDKIGINLAGWNDTTILVSGFGSALYGSTYSIGPGDVITIVVNGPNGDGTATISTTIPA